MTTTRTIAALITLSATFGASGAEAANVGSGRIRQFASRQVTPDFFVATTGSDTNSCTSEWSPCLTIKAAQTKVRAALAGVNGKNRPWTVEIKGGVYYLDEPLVFTAADSGGAERALVTWRTTNDEKAILSGGKLLGAFTDPGGGAPWQLTTAVSQLQTGQWNPFTLWKDDERVPTPRSPSQTTYFELQGHETFGLAPTNNTNRFTYTAGDISPTIANPQDVRVLLKLTWSATNLPLLPSIDDVNHKITTLAWNATLYNGFQPSASGSPYFLDNVKENLATQLGTFYNDRTPTSLFYTGKVSYMPKAGETINTMDMVIPVHDHVMFVSNTNDGTAVVKNIRFEGLTFAHTNWRTPLFGDASKNQGLPLPAAIHVAGADNIVFDGCTIRNTGSSAITFGAGVTNSKFINGIVADIGGSGIVVTSYVPGGNDLGTRAPDVPHYAQNLFSNPQFVGKNASALAGVNVTASPNFSVAANGITQTVAGSGFENEIAYIDITYAGTFDGNGGLEKDYDLVANQYTFPTLYNHTFKGSFYVKRPAGTMPTGASVGMKIAYSKSDGSLLGWLNPAGLSTTTPGTGNLWQQKLSGTTTISNSNAAREQPRLFFRIPAGTAAGTVVNTTIRYGYPILEETTYANLMKASATGPQAISNIYIGNNLVQGFGRTKIDGVGIGLFTGSYHTAEYNYIKDGYNSGITWGYISGNGSQPYNYVLTPTGTANHYTYAPENNPKVDHLTIYRNKIETVGQEVMSDFAGIYGGGSCPGCVFSELLVSDVQGREHPQMGAYFDQGSYGVELTKSTFVDIGGSCTFHNPGGSLNIHNIACKNVSSDSSNDDNYYGNGLSIGYYGGDPGTYIVENVGDNFSKNVVSYTEWNASTSTPYMLGSVYNPKRYLGWTTSDNIYYRGSAGAPSYLFNDGNGTNSWAEWQAFNGLGYEAGTTWQDPGWTFPYAGLTGPYTKPSVTPTGWVDWDLRLAGLRDNGWPYTYRSLGIPTPQSWYAPLPDPTP